MSDAYLYDSIYLNDKGSMWKNYVRSERYFKELLKDLLFEN